MGCAGFGRWRGVVERGSFARKRDARRVASGVNQPPGSQIASVHDWVGFFDEAGKSYDTEFRKEKYAEIQQIISDEAPYVFLFYNKAWSGQNNRIQGIQPTPLGIGWNFEDWYIREDAGQ